jgi:hypothetical protein
VYSIAVKKKCLQWEITLYINDTRGKGTVEKHGNCEIDKFLFDVSRIKTTQSLPIQQPEPWQLFLFTGFSE